MNNGLIKIMERENSNIELFPILKTELLFKTITDDLKTNLKDLLFELFRNQIGGKSREIIFNSILNECSRILDEEISRVNDFTNKELIVWHRSIFMSLKSFGNSVSSKYTIRNNMEVIELFKEIFKSSFYKFLDYNSSKEKLKVNLKEKLLIKSEVKGFEYLQSRFFLSTDLYSHFPLHFDMIDKDFEIDYPLKISKSILNEGCQHEITPIFDKM